MKHMLITGPSRRLGLHLVQHYLSMGWHVSVITRQSSVELAQLKQKNLAIYEYAYTDWEALKGVCTDLRRRPLDTIIHNASLFQADESTDEFWQDQFELMFKIHMQLPMLLNNELGSHLSFSANGNIIHMSDIYVDNPNPVYSAYCASKAGLESLSKSFAKKLSPKVRVNTIQPGALKFLSNHTASEKQTVLEASLIPIEAGFAPIALTVDYILENTFLTGSAIKLDGGRSICR